MTSERIPGEKLGPESQRDVQRLLGRCMLRLQQYENALKTLLAQHEAAGTVEEMKAYVVARTEWLSVQTLGTLARLMFESFVVPEGFERELLPEGKAPADRFVFSHSTRITLTPAHWQTTKESVQQMVTLRNELAHHFLSRFNLWEEQGCAQAVTYLEESYRRIDAHFRELRAWAMCWVEARAFAASFLQTEYGQDVMFNGINPDGSFEWRNTGIVRALRVEIEYLAGKGWTPLADVMVRMSERHHNQTPQKYRCSSWPQVLTESGEFDISYRSDPAEPSRKAWVRLRQAPPAAKRRKHPGRPALTPPPSFTLSGG